MAFYLNRRKIVISPDYCNNKQVKEFIENLPEFFDKKGIILFKKRNVIKQFFLDTEDDILKNIVVKRYKRPVIFQRVVYSFFRKSKAKRAFHNANILRSRGINTPREIGYIEQWKNGLFEYGYFISANDTGIPIIEKLTNKKIGEYDLKLALSFATFIAELHEKGILHHDLNTSNVLFHTEGNDYSFSVIDINRMKTYPKGVLPTQKECFKNMSRFTAHTQLFDIVVRHYAECRKLNIQETIKEAWSIKHQYENRRQRKKTILRFLFPGRR